MQRISLRSDCKTEGCEGAVGYIVERGGQDCVYCDSCKRWQYNAPRTETGRKQRSVQTTHEAIKPKQRARIITRATGRCEMCGKRAELHVGHLLSVDAGIRLGLSDSEVNDDENLAATCAECNLGLGADPVPLRLAVSILRARLGVVNA